jgi:hypothetical protein
VKFLIATISILWLTPLVHAQTLDSIFFNLYTDSLKKGTYNYINVEGHFTDGTYLPLSSKELKFTSSSGTFNGNSLYIDSSFKEEKVKIKAQVIKNPKMEKEIEIYIKKYIEDEKLPTMDDVMGRNPASGRKGKKRRG